MAPSDIAVFTKKIYNTKGTIQEFPHLTLQECLENKKICTVLTWDFAVGQIAKMLNHYAGYLIGHQNITQCFSFKCPNLNFEEFHTKK